LIRAVKMFVTSDDPARSTARRATTLVLMKRGRAEMQRQTSSTPTTLSIPSKLGTTSSVSRLAHTSMRSRASRGCGAGSRELKEDARAPKSRPRVGRRRNRRMLPVKELPRANKREKRVKMGPTKQFTLSYRPAKDLARDFPPPGLRPEEG